MKDSKNSHFILFIYITLLFIDVSSTAKPPFACDLSNPSTKSYTFCNTSLPISQRVEGLISRLTLDEKISQLVDTAPSIPRLGIPSYQWWSESWHGVSSSGRGIKFNGETISSATSFPQVILTSSSFDSHLWYRIGQMGMRARNTWGRSNGYRKYSVSYVRGIQGDSFEGGKLKGDHLQASACCKHFTAYDLDNWNGTNRFVFNAQILINPFKSCVEEGKASGIMCAYNRVNGIPSCADYDLLSKTARGAWGFNGYITSDCDAVSIIYDDQGYAKTPEDAVHDVLKAGLHGFELWVLQKHTKSAVEQKILRESDVDRALSNLFTTRMRLGLFNGGPIQQPYGDTGQKHVCFPDHQGLALEAARNGIVFLKNSAKRLPLSKATINPCWNYFGPPCKSITPLEAFKSYVREISYTPGCDSVACNSSVSIEVKLETSVDTVILIMGLDQTQERESHDRVDLVLPGKQQHLITTVAKAAKKPVILVILSGGPVDISFAKNDGNIGSIIWADFIKIPMTDMRMRPDPTSHYSDLSWEF
ncbi:hypothetical protein MKX01_037113 [Papaver californicum]|nr:hypothetical protein MKX01_037113 [Papaver californicum]